MMAARCPKCDYHLETEDGGLVCLVCQRDDLRAKVARLEERNAVSSVALLRFMSTAAHGGETTQCICPACILGYAALSDAGEGKPKCRGVHEGTPYDVAEVWPQSRSQERRYKAQGWLPPEVREQAREAIWGLGYVDRDKGWHAKGCMSGNRGPDFKCPSWCVEARAALDALEEK
jgi:hypothetical protein